jgi:hypothetical protein
MNYIKELARSPLFYPSIAGTTMLFAINEATSTCGHHAGAHMAAYTLLWAAMYPVFDFIRKRVGE